MLGDGLIVTKTLDNITYYFRTDKGTQWQTSMQVWLMNKPDA